MRIHLLLLCFFLCFLSCEHKDLVVEKGNPALGLVNGQLYYQNKPFNGLLVSKFADQSIKMKLQYEDGRKQGLEEQWHPNGELAQRRTYSKGVKTGNHLGWWGNGVPKFDYHYNGKGAYHGSRKEWYTNGRLIRHFNYLNGKEAGSQRMWMDTGKIRANYDVVNGERFGLIGLKKCYTVHIDSNELN